jgi:Transposase zinc-binding domain
MNRPILEVADIIRAAGNSFVEKYGKCLSWLQLKVLQAIECCRTAALGGHVDQCSQCGYRAISYNSCGNRHCPKCQTCPRKMADRTQSGTVAGELCA